MDLTGEQVAAAFAVQLTNGTDVNNFFASQVNGHFIDWFNTHCANKEAWAQKALGSSGEVKARFQQIWDQLPVIFGEPSINLLQFSALMSILVNEVGAALLPITEKWGLPGHPGLAYLFDSIAGVKRTYNAAPQNKLAGNLFFNDADFWPAHQSLPLANEVRARSDLQTAWNGSVYSQTTFPPDIVTAEPNFIQQADFCKFRGRGFIQMTWRSNYKMLVPFVQNYTGDNQPVAFYAAAWSGKTADTVCSITTNADWDALFMNTDLIVPCKAIGLHNAASGGYLGLSAQADVLNSTVDEVSSFFRMGYRISGGQAYALLFRNRVVQLLNTLNFQG